MIGILIHDVTQNSLMLGAIIRGVGKHGDVIRIICGRRKSKFELIANEEKDG